MAPGVMVQPNIVQMPVTSDNLAGSSAGLPHIYAAPSFIGYQPINLAEHMMPQSIRFPPPPASGLQQQGLTCGSADAMSPLANDLNCANSAMEVIATQASMHPISTFHQQYSAQAGAQTLFYPPADPSGLPPRGAPFVYIPMPYGPPAPYHVQPPLTGTLPVAPYAVVSDNVEAPHIDSFTIKSDTSLDKDEGVVCDDDVNTEDNEVIESNVNDDVYNESSDDPWTRENYCDDGSADCVVEIENCKVSDDDAIAQDSQNIVPSAENSSVESPITVKQSVQENAWSKPRSWASLFTKNSTNDVTRHLGSPPTGCNVNGVKSDDEFENRVSIGNDKMAAKIGGTLPLPLTTIYSIFSSYPSCGSSIKLKQTCLR